MSPKAFIIVCLLVLAMASVIAFYFWWVNKELDRDEAKDRRLDTDTDEIG